MNITLVRQGANLRFAEARELLQYIRDAEQDRGPLEPLSLLAATLRGAFYVQIYGALEFCITQGSQRFVEFACSMEIQHCHLEHGFNSIALDAELTSLPTKGDKKKWGTRREIFKKANSDLRAAISETVFGAFLQNVHPETIAELFSCFCITAPAMSENSHIGYLKELVEKRNAVSHGRTTASEAGEGKTSTELESLMNAVYAVTLYFLVTLQEQALGLCFVQSIVRSSYVAKAEEITQNAIN